MPGPINITITGLSDLRRALEKSKQSAKDAMDRAVSREATELREKMAPDFARCMAAYHGLAPPGWPSRPHEGSPAPRDDGPKWQGKGKRK